MNIFATYSCPYKSAKFLDNKRMVKMILESAQLLSSAIWLNGGKGFYKLTHKNHPVTKWTAENKNNYCWVMCHFFALCERYENRYKKVHKSLDHKEQIIKGQFKIPLSTKPGISFVNCAENKLLGISYKHVMNPHLAYRLYLKDRWKTDKRKPEWT